jgi:hypothetical protein
VEQAQNGKSDFARRRKVYVRSHDVCVYSLSHDDILLVGKKEKEICKIRYCVGGIEAENEREYSRKKQSLRLPRTLYLGNNMTQLPVLVRFFIPSSSSSGYFIE